MNRICWTLQLDICWKTPIWNQKGLGIETSTLLQDLDLANGTELQVSPVEAHWATEIGERYYAPLQRIQLVLRSSHSSLDKQINLWLSIKGMNDYFGPEGLVPSLLVFMVRSFRPVTKKALPIQKERMPALSQKRAEMGTITAELKINCPLELNIKIYLEIMCVYEEKDCKWDGPAKIIRTKKKQVTVTDGVAVKTFGISQVIPADVNINERDPKRLPHGLRNTSRDSLHSFPYRKYWPRWPKSKE